MNKYTIIAFIIGLFLGGAAVNGIISPQNASKEQTSLERFEIQENSYWAGAKLMSDYFKYRCIQEGVAHYVLDDKTGTVEFRFITQAHP